MPGDFAYKHTSLSLHCDGTDGSTTVTDNSFTPKTVTCSNGAALTTSDKKFGTASLNFDGSNDLATVPASADFVFGVEPFTIEFWMKSSQGNSAAGNYYPTMVDMRPSGTLVHGALIIINRVPGADWLAAVIFDGSANVSLDTGVGVCDGQWHHIALTRAGTTLMMFKDGVMFSRSISASLQVGVSGHQFRLGHNVRDNAYYNGLLDDLRITKGVCRYSAPFTPPAATFDDYGVTVDTTSVLNPSLNFATAPVAAAIAGKQHAPIRQARDMEHSGLGTISGTVAIDSTPDIPVRRLVRLVRDRDGLVVRETYSDATTGAYSFPEINQNVRYSAIAYDAYHDRRAVIADNLTPEIA